MNRDIPKVMGIPIDDLVKSALESSNMDRNKAYADRGRRFAHLSEADALAAWKASIIIYSRDTTHQPSFDDFQDLDAELNLRGIDSPYDEVQTAFAAMTEAARTTMTTMAQDPESHAILKETLGDEIVKYLSTRSGPQN